MSKRVIFLLSFILFFSLSSLFADTIIVDTAGAGDYTTIQEGINAAVNGDTVLVYPGTYYENINYNGKNITVASKYIITQNNSYIDSTIIDGNQNGSVVTFKSGEDSTAVLCGFTVANGTGTMDLFNSLCGGGIFCKNSSPTIIKCSVKDNSALLGGGIFCRYANIILDSNVIRDNVGGGIYCTHSTIKLTNTDIFYNHFYWGAGGGISFTMQSVGIFDSEERCNIYLNYAGQSNDIYATSLCPIFDVFLDTATVTTDLKDFIYFYNDNQPTIDILHGKIEPINHDLFVSPDGDDANSGLTPDDPFKTISWALINVASDSTHPNTIHLADGVYSPELTGEKFPLNMRSYVSLIGESEEGTILDANEISPLIECIFGDYKFHIENLTIQNSMGFNSGGLNFSENSSAIVKNLTLKNNTDDGGGGGIYCGRNSNPLFERVTIVNNTADIGGGAWISGNPVFINCDISNNTATDPYGGTGGIVAGSGTIINSKLTNNNGQLIGAAYISSGTEDFINVTVSGHSNPQGTFHIYNNQTFKLINSILWDDGNEIYYAFGGSCGPSFVDISYSDIKGGESGINTNGNGTYHWGPGNINQTPLFVDSFNNNYQLQQGSPCIDAGTPDTTGLNLPPTDLAGNPRIYNGRIDIGAYEWQGEGISEPDTTFVNELYLFQNTPNPFKDETEILFITTDYERVKDYTLSIYNIRGQRIRTYNGRTNDFWVKTKITWDGTDENGNKVSPGVYFYKLEYGDNAVVRKMTLVE